MTRLTAREIYRDTDLRLLMVEASECQSQKTGTRYHAYGIKKPVAIIVSRKEKTYALDMEAKPLSMEQLSQDVPGLDALVHKRAKSA